MLLLQAKILVNDESIDLDTTNTFIEYEIKDMLKEGNNYIEVRPSNEFRIDELKISYE